LILDYQDGRELEVLIAKCLGRFNKISGRKKTTLAKLRSSIRNVPALYASKSSLPADERKELSDLLLEFLEQASHALL
jgi:hypothetical protein